MTIWLYIAQRALNTIPVLIGVSFMVFMVLHLAPGDPTIPMLGAEWNPTDAARLRENLGLDRPLLVQYTSWLGKVAGGDMGFQYTTRQPVFDAISQRLPTTFILAIGAMVIAIITAIPLGVLCAVYRDTWIDAVTRLLALIGLSMPVFWLGILLIILFSVQVRWLPPGGGWEQHGLVAFVLPWVTLSTSYAALIMRMLRGSILEVLTEDYVRTARAKGLRANAIMFGHVMKNAAFPVITVVGMQFGSLLGGAVLTEIIFSLPGLGRLLYASINSRDYPTLQGSILVVALCFIVANLIVDILYAALDPRVRYG